MTDHSSLESPPDTINETLENFAHAHDLNVHQVKNIIYHILTDQNLFATLLGNDKDNAPHVKLTRSRWREIQTQVKTKIPLPLEIRQNSSPSNFLNMELDEDSDDSEYFPPPTPLADRIAQQEFEAMWCRDDSAFDFPGNSNFGNGEYGRFIYDTFIHYKPYDEYDIHDQDYNVMEDLQQVEKEDKLEYRYDKTTRISKKEMMDLWKELEINVEGNVLNLDPPLPTPKKRISDKGCELKQTKKKVNLANVFEPSTAITLLDNEAHEIQPCTSASLIQTRAPSEISVRESTPVRVIVAPLMQKPLRISREEWRIMKEQAELLIQSLTQVCLLTADDNSNEGAECFNHSANKINELIFLARSENALFKDTPIEEACDLVWNYKEKVNAFTNVPDFQYSNKSADDGYQLPHYVRFAISTSTVFKYPKLLSLKRIPTTKKSYFSPGEQALLALGLKYFYRVPLGRRGSEEGKYQYICKTLLPYRTPVQIRVHIKNARQSPVTARTSVGKHLMAAISGNWNPDNASFFQFTRISDLPIDWKKELQPLWLQELASCRIYKKFADCILATFCIRNNRLVPASDQNTSETKTFFKSLVMPLEKEKSLPVHKVVWDKAEGLLLFKRITESFPDILSYCNANSDSMTENSISSLTDLNNVEDQRILNPVLLSDHLSDGYSRSCSTEDSNFYLESLNKRENHTLEPDLRCYEQIPELIEDFAPDGEYLEQASRKKDDSNSTRLTAQQRKHLEVLQALTDPENRKKANQGLVAAVCNDINRRFFMHEEKLRQFRRILSQPEKNKHEIIRELDVALGEQDRELVFIVACLMNDEEIVQILSDDPQFRVVRRALNMIMDVQAYVYGTRGLKTLKRIAANFRNEKLTNGEELKCILKNLFRRDDKLYKLFIPDDIQSINHERFEVINLSNGSSTITDPEKVIFETVEIPFNRPKQGVSKSQPQLKHGNIVIETSSGDTCIDVRYEFNRSWNPEEDLELLETMRENDLDLQVAAENYCRNNPNSGVTVIEAYQRLLDLQAVKK